MFFSFLKQLCQLIFNNFTVIKCLNNVKVMNEKSFIERFTYEERLRESRQIMIKYPSSAPLIVEPKDEKTLRIYKNKFIVPWDLTYGQFLYIIRKRLKINPNESIFMFCNGTLPSSQDTIQSVYQRHGNNDGFLYLLYAFENTFG